MNPVTFLWWFNVVCWLIGATGLAVALVLLAEIITTHRRKK